MPVLQQVYIARKSCKSSLLETRKGGFQPLIDKLVPCSEFFMKCFNGMTVICTAEQCNVSLTFQTSFFKNYLQEKFPYNKRMDHLNECKGIYECKFCDAKTQVKDNHKNECIGYLQEKLKKMELLIQDRIEENIIESQKG